MKLHIWITFSVEALIGQKTYQFFNFKCLILEAIPWIIIKIIEKLYCKFQIDIHKKQIIGTKSWISLRTRTSQSLASSAMARFCCLLIICCLSCDFINFINRFKSHQAKGMKRSQDRGSSVFVRKRSDPRTLISIMSSRLFSIWAH